MEIKPYYAYTFELDAASEVTGCGRERQQATLLGNTPNEAERPHRRWVSEFGCNWITEPRSPHCSISPSTPSCADAPR